MASLARISHRAFTNLALHHPNPGIVSCFYTSRHSISTGKFNNMPFWNPSDFFVKTIYKKMNFLQYLFPFPELNFFPSNWIWNIQTRDLAITSDIWEKFWQTYFDWRISIILFCYFKELGRILRLEEPKNKFRGEIFNSPKAFGEF